MRQIDPPIFLTIETVAFDATHSIVVSVAMYYDRLGISNPGTFYFGMTPERLTQAHESRLWNPLIAQVLYRAGIMERWGTYAQYHGLLPRKPCSRSDMGRADGVCCHHVSTGCGIQVGLGRSDQPRYRAR